MAQAPGRKPTPTAMKELAGNPGKRPINEAEPKPDGLDDLEPPYPLDDMARREWDRIAPQLDKLGLLTVADSVALYMYCRAFARYHEAERIVAEEGILIPGYRGSMVKNPAAQIARDAFADLLRICTEFGMTPSSRGRMSVPGSDEGDTGLESFLL